MEKALLTRDFSRLWRNPLMIPLLWHLHIEDDAFHPGEDLMLGELRGYFYVYFQDFTSLAFFWPRGDLRYIWRKSGENGCLSREIML
jgi:hypothetical protein